jgi:D-alanyl-D-alanine-carboxypeptidase/D-alanyl-D-alanine-endopeptidase
MTKRVWLRAWAGMFGVLLMACVAQAERPLAERIDALVKPYLDGEVVAGLTIGVLRDGKAEFFGYGRANDSGSARPDADTIYEIGSISKVFTGVLLADAVERGEVKLDTPLRAIWPAKFSDSRVGDITLLQLSTHTSGLPKLPSNLQPKVVANPYADYDKARLRQYLIGHQLRRAPGTASEYSNIGVGLLGRLLADRDKTSYAALLEDRITKPLKMSSTALSVPQKDRGRLATPHLASGAVTSPWDFQALAGAGGIKSTARDMLRFAEASLAPPNDELGKALELAWQEHRKPLESHVAMGLGWHIARDGATRWHNGGTGGFKSMLLVDRRNNSAVIVLANTAAGEVTLLAEDIMQLVNGVDVKPRTFKAPLKVDHAVMDAYVGRFELGPGAFFTVTREGDRLMVGLTGQPAVRVFPENDREWRYKEVPAKLVFLRDADGKCNALELHQNGLTLVAKRVKEPAKAGAGSR